MQNSLKTLVSSAFGGTLLALLLAQPLAAAEQPHAVAEGEQIPLDDLRLFADVFGRIKSQYVEPVSDKKLLEYAVRGMLEGLDPHSAFLNEEGFKDLREDTSGEFGGLGMEVGMEDGFVKVIAPIDDSPAKAAGIEPGDLVIKLDGQVLKGLSLADAVKLMRGKPGSEVLLTVSREGEAKPLQFKIKRDVIKHASVKSRMLEPGFGYVRLSQFQTHSSRDMLKAIDAQKKESGGRINGLVLDLRNNPGGVLDGAVAVSDAFLNGGLVVYTEGRGEDSQLRFNAAPGDVLDGAPLIVLINGGSASASEIVAGALQDQRRAIIMGQKSFGKGSVQTILPISSKAAIKLTTARYFTPNGRSIQAEGIVPDIEVKPAEVKLVEQKGTRVKEADLRAHLANPKPNGNGNGHDKDDKESAAPAKDGAKQTEESLATTDFELSEALNLLKGLAILGKAGN